MIQRIAESCSNVSFEGHNYFSYVATCDLVICDYIESIGLNSVMTSGDHEMFG